MNVISDIDWDSFRALHETDVQDTFFQQQIIWKRQRTRVDRFGEDNSSATVDSISLKCLLNYNFMRTWPISKTGEAGETDEQSIQIYFGKKYLRDLGYLDANDYFAYDPGYDRFVIDGMIMKPMGDSSVAQIQTNSLLVSVIVVRQPPATGKLR